MNILDKWLFGSGKGFGWPALNQTFYYMDGETYTISFGYGAQLSSTQWFAPKVGEVRQIGNYRFRPFNCTRHGPRVRVSWARWPDVTDREDVEKLIEDLKLYARG